MWLETQGSCGTLDGGAKVAALDAAAQVLAASKEPMNVKEMIEAMAKRAL